MKFGIPPKSMKLIISALARREEVQQAAIFGSRALGNYKNGSDIDMVVYGEHITEVMLYQLLVEFNEKLPIPYYFDLVHYEALQHAGLKQHIDEFAQVFYRKDQIAMALEKSLPTAVK